MVVLYRLSELKVPSFGGWVCRNSAHIPHNENTEAQLTEAIISPSSTSKAERRTDCRYPIRTGIEYKLILGRRIVRTGAGRLVNISRGGLLFEGAQELPPRTRIELDVDWPADAVKVALHVVGETLRSQGARTAVKIHRSSFRVREEANNGKHPVTPA